MYVFLIYSYISYINNHKCMLNTYEYVIFMDIHNDFDIYSYMYIFIRYICTYLDINCKIIPEYSNIRTLNGCSIFHIPCSI